MKCPVDGAELKMAERQGIEIDYCPQCRGVWLDRGELVKIIEKATPVVELENPDPLWGTPEPARDPHHHAPQHHEERYDDRYVGRADARPDEERHFDRRDEADYAKKRRKDKSRKRDKYDDRDKYLRKKKRKSFLKELFDVFD